MTPLISDNLILDLKRHSNIATSETEREEYVEALKTALLIQSGAYHVYALDEETQYAERIHTLEQLGEFGRNHPAAWAYYLLPGVSREPHDLGDFDEHGGLSGTLLCMILPYDDEKPESEAGSRVLADFSSESEAIDFLRKHSLFEAEDEGG
jgi:hypothetical protein